MSGDDVWDEDDFESCWKELREKSPIIVVSDRASDLKSQLEIACAKTAFDLAQFAQKYNGQPLTPDVLGNLVARAVLIFMEKWTESLRSQNLAGLVEVILEGQDLSPNELKGFLQALPDRFLDKALASPLGTMTGVHAIVAMEYHLRRRGIRDYNIGKESDRTYVSFIDPSRNVEVKFYTDETFDLT